MMYTVCNRHPLVEMCMLFVGTSIIHHSTEGIFILCNIWDLLIYSIKEMYRIFHPESGKSQDMLYKRNKTMVIVEGRN